MAWGRGVQVTFKKCYNNVHVQILSKVKYTVQVQEYIGSRIQDHNLVHFIN